MSATYTVQITRRDAQTAGAFVTKTDGTQYTVAIGPDWAACSCKAGIYHGHCKHPAMVKDELAAVYQHVATETGALLLRNWKLVSEFSGPDANTDARKALEQIEAKRTPKARAQKQAA